MDLGARRGKGRFDRTSPYPLRHPHSNKAPIRAARTGGVHGHTAPWPMVMAEGRSKIKVWDDKPDVSVSLDVFENEDLEGLDDDDDDE